LPILRKAGDPEQILTLVGLSRLARLQDNSQTACAYGRQARDAAQNLVNRHLEATAWQQRGHALHALGDLAQAADAYQQALNMRRAMGEHNLVMESLAGLADVARAQDDPDQALEYVAEILRHLETGTLDGAEEPFRVYLTCYHVLQAHEDPRARDVLTTAHDLLGQRAATIEDEEMRRAYLEEVDVHRELAREFAARVCA
jgi:tetratricopeptide (TPR) repeat protein